MEGKRRLLRGGEEREGGEFGHDGAVVRTSVLGPHLSRREVRCQRKTAENVVDPRAVVCLPAARMSGHTWGIVQPCYYNNVRRGTTHNVSKCYVRE